MKMPSVPYELIKSTSSKFNTIESISLGAWVKPESKKDFTVISKKGAWALSIKNQLLTSRFGASSPEDVGEAEYTMHPAWSDKSNEVASSSSYVPVNKWSHGKFLLLQHFLFDVSKFLSVSSLLSFYYIQRYIKERETLYKCTFYRFQKNRWPANPDHNSSRCTERYSVQWKYR